jgi:hypothetical protein
MGHLTHTDCIMMKTLRDHRSVSKTSLGRAARRYAGQLAAANRVAVHSWDIHDAHQAGMRTAGAPSRKRPAGLFRHQPAGTRPDGPGQVGRPAPEQGSGPINHSVMPAVIVSGGPPITPNRHRCALNGVQPAPAQNGGYLEPSLSMPRLPRTSAAWTCS